MMINVSHFDVDMEQYIHTRDKYRGTGKLNSWTGGVYVTGVHRDRTSFGTELYTPTVITDSKINRRPVSVCITHRASGQRLPTRSRGDIAMDGLYKSVLLVYSQYKKANIYYKDVACICQDSIGDGTWRVMYDIDNQDNDIVLTGYGAISADGNTVALAYRYRIDKSKPPFIQIWQLCNGEWVPRMVFVSDLLDYKTYGYNMAFVGNAFTLGIPNVDGGVICYNVQEVEALKVG